ncbi:unnamed protein product [Closterium sp. Naga37s-1]|nr:unnamed protein product [Closterium sp. Naga37s-1]
MALPLGKLGDLVLKTLSKPLAKAIKRRAASHPKFRASIANWAQGYHRFTVRLQRRLYGQSRLERLPFPTVPPRFPAPFPLSPLLPPPQGYHRFTVQLQRRLYGQAPLGHIKRLNEEKAVSTASEVVGELIVFAVSGLVGGWVEAIGLVGVWEGKGEGGCEWVEGLADWVERGEGLDSSFLCSPPACSCMHTDVHVLACSLSLVHGWMQVAGGVVFIEAARSALFLCMHVCLLPLHVSFMHTDMHIRACMHTCACVGAGGGGRGVHRGS